MSYLDFGRLYALDPHAFQVQTPYPWINPEGLITPDGYQRLVDSLPEVSQFTPLFGVRRAHGQPSHDRYGLEYSPSLRLAPAWQEFIDELAGSAYQRFVCRMFGVRSVDLRFHWHYTPRGCSVSPHCDAKHKLGSHIFYFNANWNPAWGGETLILDDGQRFDRRSAPQFEDFDRLIASQALGNRSLLFQRKKNSWHGVRPLECPEGQLRKVFIVVIDRSSAFDRIRRLFGRESKGY